MATRLFVGNLAENSKESDLKAAFSNYGEIIHLDLKSKSAADKKFAFVTISGSNYDIESCIKHFSNEDFNGSRLYVTRARESFLERLQRERQEAQQKEAKKTDALIESPIVNSKPLKRKKDEAITNINHRSKDDTKTLWKKNVPSGDEPNYKISGKTNKKSHNSDLEDKPQIKIENDARTKQYKTLDYNRTFENINTKQNGYEPECERSGNVLEMIKKKDSDMKRMEAMKKKRQEFRNKQMIVKTGLTSVDKVPNKKIKFTIDEDDTINNHETKLAKEQKKKTLFDEDKEDSGDELNFEIKKQFEGIKGQKVLDLQSRYKSDKRFVLDERFLEEEEVETEKVQENSSAEDEIEINQIDEKDKQLNILQDVLGVPIRRKVTEEERDGKKNKPKLGMLRFDPSQPEHAKFLAPVKDTKQESIKKSKKKKDKQTENTEVQEQEQDEPRPEVSKEQFYKVSDTLKEAIAQPTTFSLRSLFGNVEIADDDPKKEEANYIPLEPPKKSKVKNPLEPDEKNPFVYDSSDSEVEEVEKETVTRTSPVVTESKAVWKENFFFGLSDQRFEEGLAFFSSANEAEVQKERRELKSLMKKRIYNKERKDQMQMFRKKIGGRKKTMKKSFRRKN